MKSEAFVRFSHSLGKERLQRRLLQPRSQGFFPYKSSEGPRFEVTKVYPADEHRPKSNRYEDSIYQLLISVPLSFIQIDKASSAGQ